LVGTLLSFGTVCSGFVWCLEYNDYIVGQQENETFSLLCDTPNDDYYYDDFFILKSISNSPTPATESYDNNDDVYCDWEGPRRATSTHSCEDIIFECYDNILYSMKSINTQSKCPDFTFLPYNTSGIGPVTNFDAAYFHDVNGGYYAFSSVDGRLDTYGILVGDKDKESNHHYIKMKDELKIKNTKKIETSQAMATTCDTSAYEIGSCNWSGDEAYYVVSDYGFNCSDSQMIAMTASSSSSMMKMENGGSPSDCSSCDWTGPLFFKGPDDCDDMMMECYDNYIYDISFIGDHPTFSADACKSDLQAPIDPLEGLGCNWLDDDVFMTDTTLGTSVQITCDKHGKTSVFKHHDS
jgi:hypothetical protein